MIPSEDVDLFPGLPNDLANTHILHRLAWQDIESALRVNKTWRSALLHHFTHFNMEGLKHNITKIAVIHPAEEEVSCWSNRQSSDLTPLKNRGSYFTISMYDVESNSWERLPSIPGLAFGVPLGARCICVEGQLFTLGGRNPITWDFMSEVYTMDLRATKRSWRKCSHMHTARSGFACVTIGGKILVAGGQSDENLCLATVEVYDLRSQRWEQIADLNLPRNECMGAVIDDGVYIIGGYSSSSSIGDPWCLEDDEQVSTFWVSSADFIQFGSHKWKTVKGSIHMKLHKCQAVSSCGALGYVHGRVVREFWERCSEEWSVIDGKIIKRTDASPSSIMVASIIQGSQTFATKCCTDNLAAGKVSVKLCKMLSTDPADKAHLRKWQQIRCPFELNLLPLPCCLVEIPRLMRNFTDNQLIL
ncbi:hypothetical protein O6H91_01G137100 [Diphasiastrum complanatum]|uniref:Uncharacterized protein n=1 Tax=Diphasiastrum complanatum TaxID=34168 RepID=A0ACC2EX19_DIPCM|nr:hypothetical protein O6H91_Y374400 [Diphasiastrum complanatum]KAJ7570875.1 hypothetical protein O6H91_01G137100 [Diphasiastrum complanatum]